MDTHSDADRTLGHSPVSGCPTGGGAVTEASDEDQVIAAVQTLVTAMVAGDRAALRRLLRPDFRFVDGADELGREAYIEASTSSQITWRRLELDDPVVTVVGDTAVLFCTVTHQLDSPTDDECFRRRVTQTWARDVDSWRCLTGHAGPPSE